MRRSRAGIMAECDVIYLFVDASPSGCIWASRARRCLAAGGILGDGKKTAALAFGARHQGGHGELPRVLQGHAPARLPDPLMVVSDRRARRESGRSRNASHATLRQRHALAHR